MTHTTAQSTPAVKVKCHPVVEFGDELPAYNTEERFRSSVFIFLVDTRLQEAGYLSDLDRRRMEVEFKLKDYINRGAKDIQAQGIPPLTCLAICYGNPKEQGFMAKPLHGLHDSDPYDQFVRRIQAISEGEETAKVQYFCDLDDSDAFFDCLKHIAADVLHRRADAANNVFVEYLMPQQEIKPELGTTSRSCRCCRACSVM